VLPTCGVAAVQMVAERGRGDAQLTGEHGQDLGVSVLAHVQDATWEVSIRELDGEAQLSRGASVPALSNGVRRHS
jgi:predicted negative regulator of RcsB-dependent stress response